MKRTLLTMLACIILFILINPNLNTPAQAALQVQDPDLPTPSLTWEIVDTPATTSAPPVIELPTATLEPVIPQPIATDTPSLPLPTSTPAPALADLSQVALSITTLPELAYPGAALTIIWHIDLWERISAYTPELWLTLPEGFEPARQVVLPLTGPDGSIQILVGEEARGPFPITAELHAGGQMIMQVNRSLPEGNYNEIGPEGGEAVGMGGRVRVYFPPEALQGVTADNPLIVRIRPPRSSIAAAYYLSEIPFELVAEQQPGGPGTTPIPVTQFTEDVVITLSYTDEQVAGMDEAALFLYTYDPAYQSWAPVRSRVDIEANTLIAWVNHFSQFDVNAQDWEAARLPSMAAFQTAGFTGAATYSFPIQVPTGPGGLQPSLSLNYSSGVVDNASGYSQASWVGMGWSLDTGYIQRNMHGSMTWLEDDTFSLNANGVGGMMLVGTDGYYHTTDESFWRIEYVGPQSEPGTDYWIAWDKAGNQYYYGYEDSDRAHYPNLNYELCDTPQDGDDITWRWMLSKIRNIYGQELIFNNQVVTKPIYSDMCGVLSPYDADVEIILKEILYPNLRYRVFFDTSNDRLDYDLSWESTQIYIFYQRSRLNRIVIQHDPDGDGNFSNAEQVRSYDLMYAPGGQTVFPNYTWTGGGKTLTLAEIHEHGEGGAGPLPATTFTYSDGMHLTYATNGSGGWVAYSYTAWSDVDAADSATLEQSFGSAGNPCVTGEDEGGWGIFNQDSDVYCSDAGEDLVVQGTAQRGIDPGMWHPGGLYQLYANVQAYTAGDHLYLGLWDGAASYLEPDAPGYSISYQDYTQVTVTVQLPATAYRLSKFLIQLTNAHIATYKAQWLPTYYRVSEQTVGDLVTGAQYSTQYTYDEPATNDSQHSHAVAVTSPYWRYTDAYSEFRGHAMTRIRTADGQVTTTFYAQDDARAGRAQTVITGTQEFWDDFSEGLNAGNWLFDPGSASLARLRGDTALRLTGGSSEVSLWRQYHALTDNQAALMQFQTSGESNSIILGVETGTWGSDYLRYGIHILADGSLWSQYCNISTCTDETQLIGPGGVKRDTWYMLLVIVDQDHDFQLRVWERDDPESALRKTRNMGAEAHCWRLMAQSRDGNLWLDSYSEGYLNTLSDTIYDADSDAPVGVDPNALPQAAEVPHPSNTELTITWARVIQSKLLNFAGDAQFVGSRNQYEYDEYGNITRLIEADWDSTISIGQFRDFRLTQTGYAINTNGTYLVGLPAYQNLYTCRYQDTYLANGACSTSYPSWLPQAWLVSSSWNLYDNASMWNATPTQGMLTGQRKLLRFASPSTFTDTLYSDTKFAYDSYGNQTDVYQYEQENLESQFAYGTARHSTLCYGTFNRDTGACTDDGYRTYARGMTNALNHRVRVDYDLTQGLPVAVVDANGITTTAGYDVYGRLIEIRRPGDESGQATVQIFYHLAAAPYPANPFYTEFLQKIDEANTYQVNKYYSGLGQLIQSEVHGAVLATVEKRDLLVDIFYDLAGRPAQQSMPYDLIESATFHGRLGVDYNLTTYDLLGRTASVTAPDGTSTTYEYRDGYDGSSPYMEVWATDAMGHTTVTRSDLWARTVLVDPPDGPGVSYSYDAADRLVGVIYGPAVTVLQYDLAGRKTFMDDPDMGDWTYTYDALGNLRTQRDARGCTTTLSYDPLNRLTGKSYSGNCGSATTAVTYTYDQGANGIGHRIRMDDGSGYTTWSYDSRGRVIEAYQSVTGSGAFCTQWDYNAADLPLWMRYPADNAGNPGETVNYTYNTQMLVDRVNGSITYVDGTVYDAAGRVTRRELGHGTANHLITQTYTYYPWSQQGGRLQNQFSQNTASPAETLQNLVYLYDSLGNVLTIHDFVAGGPQTQTFTYDSLNRLASAVASGGSGGNYSLQEYAYDEDTGNLASNASVNYSYDNDTHIHAVTSTSDGRAFVYDANGNQTRRTMDRQTYTLVYDAENRLVQIKRGNKILATYTYDGEGNRVKTQLPNSYTVYVGNYFEWTGSIPSMKSYYYAGEQRVAMRLGIITHYFLLTDHLGSTAITTTSSGGYYSELRYMPWGGERYSSSTTTPTSYRYTGQREAEIGLYFYGARYYDPTLGRFISPDSIITRTEISLSWDRYAYSLNAPSRYVDPTGHSVRDSIWTDQDDLNGTVTQDEINTEKDSGTDDTFDYLYFTVSLSEQDLQLLLANIEWWLDFFQGVDRVLLSIEVAGFVIGAIGAFTPITIVPGVGVEVSGLLMDFICSNTSNDLDDLYHALLQSGDEDIILSMGMNRDGSWGITINGELVVFHEVYDPWGISLSEAWMISWYIGVYNRSP
jgi:RHS repeat-associated protein